MARPVCCINGDRDCVVVRSRHVSCWVTSCCHSSTFYVLASGERRLCLVCLQLLGRAGDCRSARVARGSTTRALMKLNECGSLILQCWCCSSLIFAPGGTLMTLLLGASWWRDQYVYRVPIQLGVSVRAVSRGCVMEFIRPAFAASSFRFS
jgi:hypothetical protein